MKTDNIKDCSKIEIENGRSEIKKYRSKINYIKAYLRDVNIAVLYHEDTGDRTIYDKVVSNGLEKQCPLHTLGLTPTQVAEYSKRVRLLLGKSNKSDETSSHYIRDRFKDMISKNS